MTLGLDDYQSSDEEDAPAAPQAKESKTNALSNPKRTHANSSQVDAYKAFLGS